MSNLANQPINSSFAGLLQVPGGITSSLQNVQDGNGNNTGLQISSTGINGATITGAIISNNGTSYSNAIIRPISDMFGDIGNVRDFGATGNGSTNDHDAILNANNALSNVIFSPGTYYIASNITFTKPVFFLGGASLVVAAGVTVTFNNNVSAPINKIFSLGSSANIKFNGSTPLVYPDWWGTANDNSIDDAVAIQAACDSLSPAGGIVQLLNKHYYCKTAITITTNCLTIQGTTTGASPYDNGTGGPWGTQIVGLNGVNCITANAVIYFAMNNIEMYLPLGATTATIGLLITNSFYPKIDDCRINNFSTAIKLYGPNTDVYITRCYLASYQSTVSNVYGIDIDSSNHNQNASIFVQQCIAAHDTYSGSATGYYLHGNRIADLFMDTCEADGCSVGFNIDGSGVDTGLGADIHFRGCVADGNVIGFEINSLTTDSACEIINGWSAASNIGIFVGTSARVRISGMQVYGGTDGIVSQNSTQNIIDGNTLLYQINAILLDNSKYTTIINNQGYQKTAASAAFINVQNSTTYCSIANNVANSSVSGGFGYGIIATAGCDYLSVVGNSIPPSGTTNPYALGLSVNTHSYFAGTGTPN